MSFNGSKQGVDFNAGSFLANGDETITRETRTASASSDLVITNADGTKYIPAGSAYPANDGTAEGITYEDVDVSTGDMPCSVITKNATVYKDRLRVYADGDTTVEISVSAMSALALKGFTFIDSAPAVTRPY